MAQQTNSQMATGRAGDAAGADVVETADEGIAKFSPGRETPPAPMGTERAGRRALVARPRQAPQAAVKSHAAAGWGINNYILL